MSSILTIIQIVVAVGLAVTILLQQRGAGGSGIFGVGGGTSYYTKRGFEKIVFIASIVFAALFITTAFLSLVI